MAGKQLEQVICTVLEVKVWFVCGETKYQGFFVLPCLTSLLYFGRAVLKMLPRITGIFSMSVRSLSQVSETVISLASE